MKKLGSKVGRLTNNLTLNIITLHNGQWQNGHFVIKCGGKMDIQPLGTSKGAIPHILFFILIHHPLVNLTIGHRESYNQLPIVSSRSCFCSNGVHFPFLTYFHSITLLHC